MSGQDAHTWAFLCRRVGALGRATRFVTVQAGDTLESAWDAWDIARLSDTWERMGPTYRDGQPYRPDERPRPWTVGDHVRVGDAYRTTLEAARRYYRGAAKR